MINTLLSREKGKLVERTPDMELDDVVSRSAVTDKLYHFGTATYFYGSWFFNC